MELDDVIKKRRSIRKYFDREVSEEQVAQILAAAMYSPAAGNIRNCEFIVVRDEIKKYFQFYNNERPHQSLQNKKPVEIYMGKK